MEIKIYTTEGCVWCARMKELIQRANQEYTEIEYETLDTERKKEFHEKFPSASSFPVAVIDGQYVGGLVSVAKLFLEKGLVSSNKNV